MSLITEVYYKRNIENFLDIDWEMKKSVPYNRTFLISGFRINGLYCNTFLKKH